MALFAFEPSSDELRNAYLAHLQVGTEKPSLDFLNRLILLHQERVPFENYTRILDYHKFNGGLPPIDVFIRRLESGAGGVCWTLARGFGWLLRSLKFDVEYLYMDPGHVCLKVNLDQDYYVDVGYGAPLFAACPLYQSFEVETPWERFSYQVQSGKVHVSRSPGPQKTLHFEPMTPEKVDEKFRAGNVWGQNRFLTMLLIGKFENGKLIRIANQKFQDFRSGISLETHLNDVQTAEHLENIFGMKKSYFEKSKALLLENGLMI